MAIVETRLSVWEVLAGRAPGQPIGPADPGLWAAVVERLNPTRAKPRLRQGIEGARLTSVRGVGYVMLRSPDDDGSAAYLRLTPDEVALAELMDGTRTVARLVAEFVRISGRLAPDQVTRVVADLAGNRMLHELPVNAFHRLDRVHRRPWPVRLGRGLLAAARGQRMVVANVDGAVELLYRAGGRLLFTRVAAVLCGLIATAGFGLFVWTWWVGDQSFFLAGGSYALGALVLLGLNIVALCCHELGHALATKHAGRRIPAAGFLVYFGIPSVFVDTTDVWMAGRRGRLLATASGPAAGLILAGTAQVAGFVFPELAPWTFKLSFAWYLNALFNLNPFLALDGYYLLMDWLELPNLRTRGLAWVAARLRRRPPRWAELDREGRLIALYGVLAVLWLVIAANLAYRIYADRVSGLVTGLWRAGWGARVLILAIVAGLASPVVYGLIRWLGRLWRRGRQHFAERRTARDLPRRIEALRGSTLGALPTDTLARLARTAAWVRPRSGTQMVFAGTAQRSVFVVVDGALEARRPGDPSGTLRHRVGPGGVVGLANAITGTPASLAWHTAGTTLLAVPSAVVAAVIGPLPGPPPAERADVEDLLTATPAFAALSEEDILALASRASLVALAPGTPVVLGGADDAILVASGTVVIPDGTELRRGSLIGPAGEELTGEVASARTSARLWLLPAVSSMPGLVAAIGAASTDSLILAEAASGAGALDSVSNGSGPNGSGPNGSGPNGADGLVVGGASANAAGAGATAAVAAGMNGSDGRAGVRASIPVMRASAGSAALSSAALGSSGRGSSEPGSVGPRSSGTPSTPGGRPTSGAHPAGGYPPLASPPGPPPMNVDDSTDRRFEKLMWRLVLVLALLALLLTGSHLLHGPAWAEMRADQAMLRVDQGNASVVVGGKPFSLARGDQIYVSENDTIDLGARTLARLTFRGGATSVLCPGSALTVGALAAVGVRPATPSGNLWLRNGLMLADTASPSRTFRPLALRVSSVGNNIVNDGPSWYRIGAGGADVATGVVTVNGDRQPSTDEELSCGDGVAIERPSGTPSPTPPTPSPSSPASASPSPSPSSSITPNTPGLVPGVPTPTPIPRPTLPPVVPPPVSPTSGPPSSNPPTDNPPKITWVHDPGASNEQIGQDLGKGKSCSAEDSYVYPVVSVDDDRDPQQALSVTVYWSGFATGQNTMNWDSNSHLAGVVGPIPYPGQSNRGGTLSISVVAVDAQGHKSEAPGTDVIVQPCSPSPPPIT